MSLSDKMRYCAFAETFVLIQGFLFSPPLNLLDTLECIDIELMIHTLALCPGCWILGQTIKESNNQTIKTNVELMYQIAIENTDKGGFLFSHVHRS